MSIAIATGVPSPVGQPTVLPPAAARPAPRCAACSLAPCCLSAGLGGADLDRLNAIVHRVRPLRRDAYLFQAGKPLDNLYMLRSGSVKTVLPGGNGGEQVTGFHLPGDLLGLHAIAAGRYGASARTLETSSFCIIPYHRLEALGGELPRIRQQLVQALSRKLSDHQGLLLILGKHTAEARLAGLLVHLSGRHADLGRSATELHLSMSRHDIGNYLGLAMETVSRQLRRFQDQGLVEVHNKRLRLLDPEGLHTVAAGA